MELSKDKGSFIGMMGLIILEVLSAGGFKAKALINGKMEGFMLASGKKIKWRGKEYLLGQMAVYMMESILLTLKKEMANLYGLMGNLLQ